MTDEMKLRKRANHNRALSPSVLDGLCSTRERYTGLVV